MKRRALERGSDSRYITIQGGRNGKYTLRAAAVDRVLEESKGFREKLSQLSAMEAAADPPVDFSKLPDIREPGPFGSRRSKPGS